MNVDGSMRRPPGSRYAGMIFRNSRGFFVAAATRPTGWGSPFEAELADCFMAIRSEAQRGWFNLWVESDSKLTVKALNEGSTSVPWCLRALWSQVWDFRYVLNILGSLIYTGRVIRQRIVWHGYE